MALKFIEIITNGATTLMIGLNNVRHKIKTNIKKRYYLNQMVLFEIRNHTTLYIVSGRKKYRKHTCAC